MALDALQEPLKSKVQQIVEVLKSGGAKAAWVYGACLQSWNEKDDLSLAVEGVEEDHLLRLSGRILMDLKISTDLCTDAEGEAFALQGKKGVQVL